MASGGVLAGTAIGVPVSLILFVVVIIGGGGSSASPAAEPGGLASGAPLQGSAVPNQAWVPWIEKAGSLCSTIPAPVIAAQIETESNWSPHAVSPTGAQGLSQFEPYTWPAYGADDAGDGNVSPLNPIDAIMAQGRYDCALAAEVAPVATKSGQSLLTLTLDAYNAGPGAVQAAGGIPQNSQTEAYAPKIEALAAKYTAAQALVSITPGASGFANAEIAAAQAQLGKPYVWGGGTGMGPSGSAVAPAGMVGEPGFDCSGLILFAAFQASGGQIALPHSSEIMATLGQTVATGPGAAVLASGQLQPGDAIAFQLSPGDYDHIGLYVGNGEMIAAPETGKTVDIENLNTSYWLGVQWSARRFA